MSANHYDAIVVGGGHNGLVCAAYLARTGARVVVLERRHLLGGASVTEETWPGYRVSSAAYVVSLFAQEIVTELGLPRYGYHVYPLDPAYCAPFPDGSSFLVWDDPARAAEEIARISPSDGRAYLAYSAELNDMAELIRPLLFKLPPEIALKRGSDIGHALNLAAYVTRRRRELARLVDIMTMSAADYLARYFTDERVMGGLCAGGVIGAWGGPMSPGTAYVLLHHRMGEVVGITGAWGFVRGGMGALSNAIADAARAAGAEIRTEAEVASIDVTDGAVTGVTLVDGTELRARVVASGAHPHTTLLGLLGPRHLPDEMVEALRRFRTRGSSAKVNMALSELPDLIARPGKELGPHHPEFIISPTIDYVERAWDEAKYGRFSREPLLDCVIPTTRDDSLAPAGKHILTAFVQYAPYELADGTWEDNRDRLGNRVIDTIARYAPNVPDAIEHVEVLTPVDLETRFGLLGGNIFHGEMSLDQLFSFRPGPGLARYSTPVGGLYLCGSGTHPGGGVMGIPGYNAAKIIRRDLKRRKARAG